jgi:DNA gyrase subunit B
MHFSDKPLKLTDSKQHGAGCELFIVEGDSAAGAVASLRNQRLQAVLPMQGKPLNAMKASAERVAQYPLFKMLNEALGVSLVDHRTGEVGSTVGAQFERVVLLFDPDADGIHCGALMLMYFYRWQRPWLEQERVHLVRAPLFVLSSEIAATRWNAYSPEHAGKLLTALKARGITDIKSHHHRGLASIESRLLRESCIDPETRNGEVIRVSDAEAAIHVFSGM